MKTVDFGTYDGNGSQIEKGSGSLGDGEEVQATWVTPDVCTDGSLFVTQPVGAAEIHATFLEKTKVGMMDVSWQFGEKALKPNTAYSAVAKVVGASTPGLTFKLQIKQR